MQTFDIEPRVIGNVHVGNHRRNNVIWAGKLAEKGTGGKVFFDGSDNFVVLEVGKRGSGKSYGMASLLEGFAVADSSQIAKHKDKRAVLLLDPLDIHWTAVLPLKDEGPEPLRKQHRILASWQDLRPEAIKADVWIPAGLKWDIDHPAFHEYYLPVSALDGDDWSLLLQTDLILEPRGWLIYEALQKVTVRGWAKRGIAVHPREDYAIEDLIACIEGDDDIVQFYNGETIRSVIQPLKSYARMPLFSAREGTPLTDLLKAGTLSVLSLGRLEEDLRTVMTTVLIRKLRKDRMRASQITRRLSLQNLDASIKQKLEERL